MGEWRFDSWTRRRFGLTTGSLAASMLGLTRVEESAAKKKNKKKKKRCRKFDASCSTGGKNTCCTGLACEPSTIDGNRCCRKLGTKCEDGSECCGTGICDDFGPGSATVCCNLEGNFCARNADCCAGFTCDEETGQCVELL